MKMKNTEYNDSEFHLFKDKNNKLLFVCENLFVMLVDHYTAIDKSNEVFKLYGKIHRIAATKKKVLDMMTFYSQCTDEYRKIGLDLIETRKDVRLLSRITLKHNKWVSVLDKIIRNITFGNIGINPVYQKTLTLKRGNYLTGAIISQEYIKISHHFFNIIERVDNVQNFYTDIGQLWNNPIVATIQGENVVSEQNGQTSGASN